MTRITESRRKKDLELEYMSSDSRPLIFSIVSWIHNTWEFQVTMIWFLIRTPREGRKWTSAYCVASAQWLEAGM